MSHFYFVLCISHRTLVFYGAKPGSGARLESFLREETVAIILLLLYRTQQAKFPSLRSPVDSSSTFPSLLIRRAAFKSLESKSSI